MLAKGRDSGVDITELICVDFFDDHPEILMGRTFVKGDHVYADYEVIPPDKENIFVVAGVPINRLFLDRLLRAFLWFPQMTVVPRDLFAAVNRDFNSDEKARAAYKGLTDILDAGTNQSSSAYIASSWSEADVKYFFNSFFASVETHMSTWVDKPNNLRIIRSCGRLEATVETDPWPACSAVAPTTAVPPKEKTKKKHWWHL